MKKKEKERQRAIILRKRGMSYLQIARKLKVSTSSLSRWLQHIPYEIKKFDITKASDAFKNRGRILHLERLLRSKSIVENAKREIGTINKRDLLIAGAILYWAEGTKHDEEVCISNSNPLIIKFAMKWFREICKVPEDRFKIQMHLHEDLDKERSLDFWQMITGIPKAQFTKPYIKKTSIGHRKNLLYYGTIKIRIGDKNLHRKIMGWIEGIHSSRIINYRVPVAQMDRATAFHKGASMWKSNAWSGCGCMQEHPMIRAICRQPLREPSETTRHTPEMVKT